MVLQHSTQQLQQLAVVRLEGLRVGIHNFIQQQEANLLGGKKNDHEHVLQYNTLSQFLLNLCILYLSVIRIAALGGLTEEIQQGRPAVWCLVFNHHCTQLGQ